MVGKNQIRLRLNGRHMALGTGAASYGEFVPRMSMTAGAGGVISGELLLPLVAGRRGQRYCGWRRSRTSTAERYGIGIRLRADPGVGIAMNAPDPHLLAPADRAVPTPLRPMHAALERACHVLPGAGEEELDAILDCGADQR